MKLLSLLSVSIFFSISVLADQSNSHRPRPDSHGPISVMGDHTHKSGEVMFSYRYMRMNMDGNLSGSSTISTAEILEDFMVTPTSMEMDMHMAGMMVAVSDRLTLSSMISYIESRMDHQTRAGGTFTTAASGLSDLQLAGLIDFFHSDHHQLILNTGVSLPTGSINKTDDTPAAEDAILPYPMQLGSGTVDLKPGLTLLSSCDSWSMGLQGMGTIRLGRNSADYALGDRFDSDLWAGYVVTDNLSLSVRSGWSIWGNIDGADPRLNPAVVPTADPSLRGGRKVDIGVGINTLLPTPAGSFRLAGEFAIPLYQNLNGPQLETDWEFTLGIQAAF